MSTESSSKRITLRLELEQGVEPVRGRLVAADGGDEEFVGWLGLGAALKRLVGETNEPIRD